MITTLFHTELADLAPDRTPKTGQEILQERLKLHPPTLNSILGILVLLLFAPYTDEQMLGPISIKITPLIKYTLLLLVPPLLLVFLLPVFYAKRRYIYKVVTIAAIIDVLSICLSTNLTGTAIKESINSKPCRGPNQVFRSIKIISIPGRNHRPANDIWKLLKECKCKVEGEGPFPRTDDNENPNSSQIRYFHEEDRAEAMRIGEYVRAGTRINLTLTYVKGYAQGQCEIWITP